MKRKCENPKHKGENPPILKKEDKGIWWLKDPEWKLWCPRCSGAWFREKVMEGIANYKVK